MRIAESHDAEVCLPADWHEQVVEAIYLDETRPGFTALEASSMLPEEVPGESNGRPTGVEKPCERRDRGEGVSSRGCATTPQRSTGTRHASSGLEEGSQYEALAGCRGSAANLAQLNTGQVQVQEELLDGVSPLPGEDHRPTMLSGDAPRCRRG
jgi:hypothetical protein